MTEAERLIESQDYPEQVRYWKRHCKSMRGDINQLEAVVYELREVITAYKHSAAKKRTAFLLLKARIDIAEAQSLVEKLKRK
jgi:hypothetical protein